MSDARPTFAEVFAEHLRFVWRIVAAHGVRPADVEDATQEVFLTVHRRFEDWDPSRGSIRTWLYGISVRTAANYRRLAHVRRERSDGDRESQAVSQDDPVEHVALGQALGQLYGVLDRMESDKRDVFVLFDMQELTMKEVSEIVGCPVKTAYTRLYAARREVHEAMGGGS